MWTTSCRYLGVYFISARYCKCEFGQAKKSFYRAVNAVFGKVLRLASEETILHLIASKCMPVLLYGLDACPISVSDIRSFDFVQTRLLMKIFNTGSITIVNKCHEMFGLKRISEMISDRKNRFLEKYQLSDNYVCRVFAGIAEKEQSKLK